MDTYQFKIIKDYPAFRKLKAEWNKLVCESQFNSIFATHEWIDSWWLNLSLKQDLLFIVTGEINDKLCAIVPLMIRKTWSYGFLVKILQFVGTPQADRCDAIIKRDEKKIIPMLGLFIIRNTKGWDQLHLNEIPQKSQFGNWIRKNCKLTFIENGSECPYVTLSKWPNWDEYYGNLSRNTRLELNKKNNLIAREGGWQFNHRSFKLSILRLLPEIQRLEKESAKAARIDNMSLLALGLKQNYFFQRVLIQRDGKYQVICSTLEKGNEIVAYMYGYVFNGCYYGYNTAYKEHYSRYFPGKLIINEVIRHSMEIGCKEFDCLRGATHLKSRWAKGFRKQMNIYQLKNCPKNWLYAALVFHLLPNMKKKKIIFEPIQKIKNNLMKNN
jgi:hypothetical protein